MANRSRRGSSGLPNKIFTFLVVGGLIFAFFKIPYDPGVSGIAEVMQSKAKTVEEWVDGVGPSIAEKVSDIIRGGKDISELPTGGGGGKDYDVPKDDAPAEAPAQENLPPVNDPNNATDSIANLKIGEANKSVKYMRSEWKHWVNVRPCWDVREEVLARQATPGSLQLTNKNKEPVSDIAEACNIVAGEWVDPFSNETFTNPSHIDIDHMIPLGYTAQHGGQEWDSNKKQDYANSLQNNNHLIAVSAKENRSKKDKGPSKWKPSNENFTCEYAKSWVSIATTWDLSVDDADAKELAAILSNC